MKKIVFKGGDKVGHGEVVVFGRIFAINSNVTFEKIGMKGVGNEKILFIFVVEGIIRIADETR